MSRPLRPARRPMLLIEMRGSTIGIRFGRERHKSFVERMQGTRGVPIRWHYFFGGRLSIRLYPARDFA